MIARRNLPAVGATRAEIKRAKKAMMKVRHWSTSRIVAGDLELRSYTADDLEPFVRSVDEDVLYWQGFHVELGWWLAPEARGKGLGRASLAAALRYVHGELGPGVARMGTEVANVRAVRQIEANGSVAVDEGPHTLPNGRVVTARWYHHEQGY